MHRQKTLFVSLAALAVATPAMAQVIELDPIVVTNADDGDEDAALPQSGAVAGVSNTTPGERDTAAAAEAALRAPAPTSVINRTAIERQGVADALQTVPGVLAPTSADDPATSVNIRGLQDHGRVIVSVDGARQNFSRSGHAGAGSFYTDGDMLKSVTITRGPATVVGGSAVGGTVELRTIDADDVLRDGETIGVRAKVGSQVNGAGALVHAEIASRITEAFDVVVAGTVDQEGDYRDGNGDRLRSANNMRSGLIKARLRVAEGHETTLSALRVFNTFDNGISTIRESEATDDTVTLTHTYAGQNPLIDFTGRVYYSGTHLDQDDVATEEFDYEGDRESLGISRSFDIKTYGAEAYNVATFDTFGFANTTTIGGDFFHDRVTSRDDAGLSSDSTPPGERDVYGAYIQHGIERGWFEVIGALRFDGYDLSGRIDDTGEDVDKSAGRISPKVTVAVTPVEPLTFYASYAEAMRAPSITETLVQGFHPPPVTFPFIPNPNLEPEVAHNIEGGVNLALDELWLPNDRLTLKASAFHNRVSEYIDLECTSIPLPGGCEYINVEEAVLRGVELAASYDTGRFYGILAATYIESENLADDTPLTTVPPSRVAATLGMRAFAGRLDLGTTVTLVGDKDDAEELDFTTGKGYGLVDAYASYDFNEDATLNLVLNNIFDRQYTQYLDIEASPGFSAKLTFDYRFGGRPTYDTSQRDML